MASSLIAAARSRSITRILKPYYSSSSSARACLFSHNLELGTNPSIPSSAPPFNRILNFGAGGFDRGLGAAIMKSKFSSSATTREWEPEPDKCKMTEPDCSLSRGGKSRARPKAAFDPTRKTRPLGLPRATLKSKFSSARSSTRESDWVSDPVKHKEIEDAVESIYAKSNVIVALSLAEVAAAALGSQLDPGSPQAAVATDNARSWLTFAVVLAIAARYYLKLSNFGTCKDHLVIGAGLGCLNVLAVACMMTYALAVFVAVQRLAALLGE